MVPLQQVDLQEIEEKISAENVCWLCFLILTGTGAEVKADLWAETTRTRPCYKRVCVIKDGLCERGQGGRCVLGVICGWRRILVDTWLCALLYESMDGLADFMLGDRPKEGLKSTIKSPVNRHASFLSDISTTRRISLTFATRKWKGWFTTLEGAALLFADSYRSSFRYLYTSTARS